MFSGFSQVCLWVCLCLRPETLLTQYLEKNFTELLALVRFGTSMNFSSFWIKASKFKVTAIDHAGILAVEIFNGRTVTAAFCPLRLQRNWIFLRNFYRTTEFYNGRTAKRQRKNGNRMVETGHYTQHGFKGRQHSLLRSGCLSVCLSVYHALSERCKIRSRNLLRIAQGL